MINDPVLLIGAGPIGSEYCKTLKTLSCTDIDILTRTALSAERAKETLSPRQTFSGGNKKLAAIAANYKLIIIVVPVCDLLSTLRVAVGNAPNARVLVEKPVSLNSADLKHFMNDFPAARVMAALNRFFFPSVITLKQILLKEPAISGRFCFTEWTHILPFDRFSGEVLARWGVANSIHLISSFFDLLGHPATMNPVREGTLNWHPSGARFYGSGRTEHGRPFAYDADWESGGRYHMEVFTKRGVYILKPLHELRFTPVGAIEDEIIEPIYDGGIKCGFEGLTKAFLDGNAEDAARLGLDNIYRHICNVEQIMGYE